MSKEPRGDGLPEGYVAVPVNRSDQAGALRVCVLVRQRPDPGVSPFVLLRDLYDARIYLGCVVDAANRVREWIELWVQDTEGLENTLPSHREAFSNAILDERWQKETAAFRRLNPEQALCTGWESRHPLPMFVDFSQPGPVHPVSPGSSTPWELCQDDQLLQKAGLPPYSSSLARYWYQPEAGAASPLVPVTAGAPENSATQPLEKACPGLDRDLAFNRQGGLMMAMRFAPLSFEDYVELLGGKSWPGLEHGKRRLSLDGAHAALTDWNQAQQEGAYLFLGPRGRAGRFVETFHLKLHLLAEMVRQARTFVQQQQLPFLNLSAESFRVSLTPVGTGLPVFWTARAGLVKPSAAFALPVETSDFRYFMRARAARTSIYLPEGLSAPLQGSGSVRIRKILPPEQGGTSLEGTLVMQEPVAMAPHDLLWIRLPLPAGRLDLYGHSYAAESMARGEIRFRTIPQRLPESAIKALRDAEGISFARSPFEIVPLLSSPCDLYSLGVLAVRALMVDDKTTLAMALDEVLSLAREAAAEHAPDLPLAQRLRTIFERDARYAESLGPHRLNREGLAPDQARQLLPTELWFEALATVVACFPGIGPDSVCRDYGDVPTLALETVFNRPLEELEKLLIRSRSLIFIDWTCNREIQSVIDECLEKTA